IILNDMMKKLFSVLNFIVILFVPAFSQEALKYQLPPDEIVRIVDAPVTPMISVSPDRTTIILIERAGLPSIKDLAADEMRLASLRIDPAVNGLSRVSYNKGFTVMNIDGSNIRTISGMLENPKTGMPLWSNDSKKFAFINKTESSIDLWVCDIIISKAEKIAGNLNTVFGAIIEWLPDNSGLIFSAVNPLRGKIPVRSPVPEGPVIQENTGKKAQAATYQDLLKDPTDEAFFEYFASSQLMLWDGSKVKALGIQGLITGAELSPDGEYLLVTMIKKPFSYLVPYSSFPLVYQIWDTEGNLLRTLFERPLIEDRPRVYDAVLPGPRGYFWRSDKPATIYWTEALDGGDYSKEMQYHDQVYLLSAPFIGEPEKFIATEMRFSSITWGNDNLAIVTEGLSRTRIRRVNTFSPSDPQKTMKKIFEYNSDDRYNNPGRFITARNLWGRNILLFDNRGRSLFLEGDGASPEGDRPFIDRYDIATGKTIRLWRSEPPYYETVSTVIDINKGLLLTNRQSVSEVPNYFIRNLKTGKLLQVTRFDNPFPQLMDVHKELVKYKRNDGVDLSFTLYLPAGYDKGKDGPLPALLWAYPREYNDPSVAGQVSGSPYTFTRISPSSALVYVTQGYAILMDAAFPIIGTEGKEPNDTFVEQLVANAEAALRKAVEMGIADTGRIAVSGHSYGAFMTANLLAHSRLFAAGIAESGAYNRTLTPFGFQNERRSYWEAPDVYNTMSPFMHADKVKDPLMLIHGMADNNSGTFPIQSERFYTALKGFGAITRLVMLPYESHGYAARESILHKHWEVLNWMNKYVKNRE
ncbi:MAG: prolyl oligopeptidase family serine peptidase, partial [Bacteroidales bacterium]